MTSLLNLLLSKSVENAEWLIKSKKVKVNSEVVTNINYKCQITDSIGYVDNFYDGYTYKTIQEGKKIKNKKLSSNVINLKKFKRK